MYQLAHTILPPNQFKRRKERDQIREEKIQNLTAKYLDGKITTKKIKDFLEEMATDKNGTLNISITQFSAIFYAFL